LKQKKPNRTEPKPEKKLEKKLSQNRKNRAKPEKTEPKPVGLNRFQFGLSFFFKNFLVWLLFFKKTIESKIITPNF
jgi:hypothetical protein